MLIKQLYLVGKVTRLVLINSLLVLLHIISDQLQHITLDLHILVVVEQLWKYPDGTNSPSSWLSSLCSTSSSFHRPHVVIIKFFCIIVGSTYLKIQGKARVRTLDGAATRFNQSVSLYNIIGGFIIVIIISYFHLNHGDQLWVIVFKSMSGSNIPQCIDNW